MRTAIRGSYSGWEKVASGVPQRTVLAPNLFIMYINDMPEKVTSYINMFADDAKILRKIENEDDCIRVQGDLNSLVEWAGKWKMRFNVSKCRVLQMGKSEKRPRRNYMIGLEELGGGGTVKDLGVRIDENMSPQGHINEVVKGAYAVG